MNIVLHQPEIPANTGNIGRTCVATGSTLHLIEPLGFRLTGKELKRAGMDYWEHLDVRRYMNFEEFLEKNPGAKIWMATTKAKKALESQKRYWWSMKIPVFVFPCWIKSEALICLIL